MGQAHGKDSYISLHDGSSLRSITPYVKTIDFNRSQSANDVTTKGAEGMTYRPGLTDGEISLAGIWDDTADVGSYVVLSGLLDDEAATTFEYGPEGNTTGMIKYSGSCSLTQYNESSPIDDMVAFTATLKISGTVTVGTFS